MSYPERNSRAEIELKERQLKELRNTKDQRHKDRQELLKLPAFQRVMGEYLGRGGLLSSVMTGNSNTYHLSGRQDYARELWNDLLAADRERAFDLLKLNLKGEES